MTILNEIITNIYDLQKGFIIRDGFIFTALTLPPNIYDAMVIRYPENANCQSTKYGKSNQSFKEHLQYVNDYCLEKAIIIANDIKFITLCPSLKYLQVIPADTAKNEFDFSPLYEMPEIISLTCQTVFGQQQNLCGSIDYSKVNGLSDLGLSISKGDLNYNKVSSLKKLTVSNFKGMDLANLFCSERLEDLTLIQCGIYSLDGIERSKNIISLSLWYNRSLSDISRLKNVSQTLKILSIENCSKISDFSCLSELVNIEHLELLGGNTLPNLQFINSLKKLKTFSFSMNVLDGDLTPCMGIPYVSLEKNRKHYNLKDKDLPKSIKISKLDTKDSGVNNNTDS